jgi:hypothetical protein
MSRIDSLRFPTSLVQEKKNGVSTVVPLSRSLDFVCDS